MKRFLAAAFLLPMVLQAGPYTDFKKSVIEPEIEPVPEIDRVQVTLQSTYVFEGGFRRGAGKLGSQDAMEYNFLASYRVRLSENWYFAIGGNYRRFDFGTSNAPLDTTLQGVAAVLSLEYVVDGKVGVFIRAFPGFYFADEIDGDSFSVPVDAVFAYPLVTQTLYAIGGISYSPFREYPVLPVAGVLWNINRNWTLEAYLPEPKLIYRPNASVAYWVGAQVAGGSFRTSERNVEPKKLSGALVSYSEVRAGIGATYEVCPGFSVEGGGGYVFAREFDYHRAGEKYGVEGAPYVQLAGRLSF